MEHNKVNSIVPCIAYILGIMYLVFRYLAKISEKLTRTIVRVKCVKISEKDEASKLGQMYFGNFGYLGGPGLSMDNQTGNNLPSQLSSHLYQSMYKIWKQSDKDFLSWNDEVSADAAA